MPNLKEPCESKRRLYVNVLHSVILYAAHVWADEFGMFNTYQSSIKKLQRSMALRVISAYRTASYESATLFARIPPVSLLAARQKRLFFKICDTRTYQEFELLSYSELYQIADKDMETQWYNMLQDATLTGTRVRSHPSCIQSMVGT